MTIQRSGRSLAMVVALVAVGTPYSATAQEAYYVLMFGSQQTPSNPNYSHSFATFVRATCPEEDSKPGTCALEAHTISWLPANLRVRTCALLPEEGNNFDLHTTLRYAYGNRERVSLWGPYQIDPDLYERALRQIALLESGKVLYKAVDVGFRSDHVSNCIHACSSIAEGYRLRVASPGWGQMASYAIVKRYQPWVIDEQQTHDWVASALGLDEYPIIYRRWESPRSGAFIGAARRFFGLERDVVPSYGPPPVR
jgi:hypothetical protein